MENKRILVTGGTGFIGSHIVDALLREGVTVICTVRKRSNLRWLREKRVELVEVDLEKREGLSEVIKDINGIIHTAGCDFKYATKRSDFLRGNALITKNIVDALTEEGKEIGKFIYISSQASFGPSRGTTPITEDSLPSPVSYYGESKLLAEEHLLSHKKQFPIVILRPSVVYGPRDTALLSYFRLIQYRILPLFYPSLLSNMLYIDDLVDAVLLAFKKDISSSSSFFIAGEGVYSLREIADTIADVMGKRYRKLNIPPWILNMCVYTSETLKGGGFPRFLSIDKLREIRAGNWICSIERAKKLLGYTPKTSLREGIEKTYKWYKEIGWLK